MSSCCARSGGKAIEDELRERLRKVEALLFGATTAGEREAAGAAAERLKAKLAEASRPDAPVEMKFTMPDQWSARLFIALCRRYGFRPFRYARQRSTTIMVKAPRRLFDAVVWRQFSDVHADLWTHFEGTTERARSRADRTAVGAGLQAANFGCAASGFQFQASSSCRRSLVVRPETIRSSTSVR